MTKMDILHIIIIMILIKKDKKKQMYHAWLSQQFPAHCNGRANATAQSACSKNRGFGGEEASPEVTLRLQRRVLQIKVYKQRRTPKVALKPQCC